MMGKLDRREFIKGSTLAVGGMVIGFHPGLRSLFAAESSHELPVPLNNWLGISSDNEATIYLDQPEAGEGVMTTLPMLIAEEAELDWMKVWVSFAPVLPMKASSAEAALSIQDEYRRLREIGAAAREMLTLAAARRWGVEPSACVAEAGFVYQLGHRDRKLSYGALAAEAARVAVPTQPRLKTPSEFRIIGKPLRRVDVADKTNGAAVYGIDIEVAEMLYGAVRACPYFGGDLLNFEQLALRRYPGVKALVRLPGGIGAVSDSFWRAEKALSGMDLQWSRPRELLDNDGIDALLEKGLERPGSLVESVGEAEGSFAGASHVVEARYDVPFLAHGAMEPVSCVASVTADGIEFWGATQRPRQLGLVLSQAFGISPEKVRVDPTLIGSSFGRRVETDYAIQAVLLSRAVGRPVKLIWSREEDFRHDFYRPAFKARMRAALDANGGVVAWECRLSGQSVMARHSPERVQGGIDPHSVEGAIGLPYEIPIRLTTHAIVDTPIPVGIWRSGGHSHNTFFVESFIDELAWKAGRDPYQFRRGLLGKSPRHRAVLDLAAEKAGWGQSLPHGVGLGIALSSSFDSILAQVAQVRVIQGRPRVEKVTCAVDCGLAINPDIVEARVQGGILHGLGAALSGRMDFDQGKARQGNFDDHPVLRMADAPSLSVHLLKGEGMGDAGELGTAAIAPAVANAIFAASGVRVRGLPILEGELV